MRNSFHNIGVPSAFIADGPIIVPLWAVTSMSLNESYHLPPIGSSQDRVLVETHDDTISLTATLPGSTRFINKEFLEILAEQSMRGTVLDAIPGSTVGGLILWTSMTLRTDIYIQSMNFSASSSRRKTIDVTMTLAHLPRPGATAFLLDYVNTAVSSLADPFVGA